MEVLASLHKVECVRVFLLGLAFPEATHTQVVDSFGHLFGLFRTGHHECRSTGLHL